MSLTLHSTCYNSFYFSFQFFEILMKFFLELYRKTNEINFLVITMLEDCWSYLSSRDIYHAWIPFSLSLRFPFRWLNDPQFVGSFETEDHVYFLFRESAVEYINCGKVRSMPQNNSPWRAHVFHHTRNTRGAIRAISDRLFWLASAV